MAKRLFFLLLILILGVLSCRAPLKYTHLPTPKKIPSYPFGSHVTVKFRNAEIMQGELIAVQGDSLIINSDSELGSLVILKEHTALVLVRIGKHTESPGGVVGSGIALGLLPFTHGFYFILTGAATTAVLVPTEQLARTHYKAEYVPKGGVPEDRFHEGAGRYTKWEDLYQFARFPQGLPPGINLNDL